MSVPGQRFSIDEVHPAMADCAGARELAQGVPVAFGKGVRLIGQEDDLGIGLRDCMQLDRWVALAATSADIVPAAAMQEVGGIGIAVERYPGFAPDRAEYPLTDQG